MLCPFLEQIVRSMWRRTPLRSVSSLQPMTLEKRLNVIGTAGSRKWCPLRRYVVGGWQDALTGVVGRSEEDGLAPAAKATV